MIYLQRKYSTMKFQSVLFVEKMLMLNQVIVLQIYYEYKIDINFFLNI